MALTRQTDQEKTDALHPLGKPPHKLGTRPIVNCHHGTRKPVEKPGVASDPGRNKEEYRIITSTDDGDGNIHAWLHSKLIGQFVKHTQKVVPTSATTRMHH